MRNISIMKALMCVALLCGGVTSFAEIPVNYDASFIGSLGSKDLAPYYISSNNHGILTQGDNALLRGMAWKPLDTGRRFSYGFGVDFLTGYSNSAVYKRYEAVYYPENLNHNNSQHPARIWLQQLFGEIKYRGVFLTVGMKQHSSKMLNSYLSSGDLVESGNARPIPEVRAGFVDFQNIPFTNGWVQISGEISYGKFTDNDWVKNHYNYYNNHISTGQWYTYKRAYFRTNPDKPFSVTFGAQAAGQFGGTTEWYQNGRVYRTETRSANLGDMFEMFIPRLSDKEGFVAGNHLGSWDLIARYRLKNDDEIKAYFQWPWEDGSGIGKQNGFDGLWGIEYKSANPALVNGAVIEYLDFTNQSGPIHWAPGDYPGTTLTAQATGRDDYYNNAYYNSYSNYGMAIGSPFMRSPIYNLDGYPAFVDNKVRGFHVGISGNILKPLDYRFLASYRKSWGSASIPRLHAVEATSLMLEAGYKVAKVPGLNLKAQVAMDFGKLYGDNFGACVTISYNGLLKIGKK